MGMLLGIKRALLRRRKKYYQKVLGTGPIAYWPMWETSGAVSQDLVLPAQAGAYTGATLGQPGIGDGRTSPFFDGANDFNDIYTAALAGRFDGNEGSVMVWIKPFNAGVWTDTSLRLALSLFVNNRNRLQFQSNGAGDFTLFKESNDIGEIVTVVEASPEWLCWVLTWSDTADELKAYRAGVQIGLTQTGIGTWVGNLSATQTLIGASTTVPVLVWHGYLAHAVIWDRPLPPATIKSLAVV